MRLFPFVRIKTIIWRMSIFISLNGSSLVKILFIVWDNGECRCVYTYSLHLFWSSIPCFHLNHFHWLWPGMDYTGSSSVEDSLLRVLRGTSVEIWWYLHLGAYNLHYCTTPHRRWCSSFHFYVAYQIFVHLLSFQDRLSCGTCEGSVCSEF